MMMMCFHSHCTIYIYLNIYIYTLFGTPHDTPPSIRCLYIYICINIFMYTGMYRIYRFIDIYMCAENNQELKKDGIVLYKHHLCAEVAFDGVGKAKRMFKYDSYGDRTLAIVAAKVFKKCCLRALADIASFSRKPDARNDLLSSHGVSAEMRKKRVTLVTQRCALIQAICDAKSAYTERQIALEVLKHAIPHESRHLTGIAPLSPLSQGFKATLKGKEQSVDKEFSSLCKAMQWLSAMVAAENVPGSTSSIHHYKYTYIYI